MATPVLDLRSGAAKVFQDRWRTETRTAMRAMNDCLRKSGLDGPPVSLPDLSTMTVVFETDQTNDVGSLQAASVEKAWAGDERHGRLVLVTPRPDGGKFRNQVSFRFDPRRPGESAKSCKVFGNGKFHMTGVRSATEALGTLSLVLKAIRSLRPGVSADESPVRILSAKVQMLNTDFRLNVPLDLEALRETIVGKYAVYCRYEPDQYPGCNIKFSRSTILAFRSGCVIITGAKSMEDVSNAYAFVLGVVLENPSVVDKAGCTRQWEDEIAKKEAKRGSKRHFLDILSDGMYGGIPILEKSSR